MESVAEDRETSSMEVEEVEVGSTSKKRAPRKPKADILKHFTRIQGHIYACVLCRKAKVAEGQNRLKRRRDGSTNTFWRHLDSVHLAEHDELKGIVRNQRTILQMVGEGSKDELDPEKVKEVIAQFVVLTVSPYSIVDNIGFKVMWKFATSRNVDPPGSRAIIAATEKMYCDMKGRLMLLLTDITAVSLTVDAWTSPNTIGMLGITVHWVDKHWELCERVLAIRELTGKHTGENMSCVLIDALRDFDLESKVAAITTDNATNNKTMVRHLEKNLKDVNSQFTTKRHLPCAAHILNLVVQEALKSLSVALTVYTPPALTLETQNLDEDPAYEDEDDATHAAEEVLRSRNPDLILGHAVAHLRALVTAIRKSTQRRQEYIEKCKFANMPNHNQLILDCPTRWNSTYDMIECALSKRQVVDEMALYILQQTEKDLRISRDEWEMLTELMGILKPFKRLCQHVCSSKSVRVTGVLRIVLGLLKHLGFVMAKLSANMLFKRGKGLSPSQIASVTKACLYMEEKLKKYQSLLFVNSAVTISTVLDPYDKGISLPLLLKEPTISGIRSLLASRHIVTEDIPCDPPQNDEDDWIDDLCGGSGSRSTRSSGTPDEELDCYLAGTERKEKNDTILDWWRSQERKYPSIAALAREFYSVCATSAPAERLFSVGQSVVTLQRSRLDAESIEYLAVTKCWLTSENPRLREDMENDDDEF